MNKLVRALVNEVLAELHETSCQECGAEPGTNIDCGTCSAMNEDSVMDRPTIKAPPPDPDEQNHKAAERNTKRRKQYRYQPPPDDRPTMIPPKR